LRWGGTLSFFLPGGCDPFNEKVLRAARGAHFKIALARGTTEDLRLWVESNHVQPLAADLHGIAPEKIPLETKRVLVLGNEAQGISKAVKEFCTPVTILMPGEMESLNVAVAGGILLYMLSRK